MVSHDAGRQVACQYKCEHFEVSAKTVENVMLLLITKVKIMMTMATDPNTPTNVIHLHNPNPNADHTHHEQMLFITCTRVTMVTWIKCIISMMHAMVDVYCMDKAVVMEYQAAQEGISISS